MESMKRLRTRSPSWWTDPAGWTANAQGTMTREQRRLVAGRAFLPWTTYFVVLLPLSAVSIVVQSAAFVLQGEMSVSEFAMCAWAALLCGGGAALIFYGHPRWKEWRCRRRLLTGRMTPQIRTAVGRIEPSGRITTPQGQITIPVNAPVLPPRGVYRFYWVESSPGVHGSLLSAQPLDPEESPEPHRALARD